MKKLVKVEEVAGEGLIGLMGQTITLFCGNYFYHGKLVGVNETFVMLENVYKVFETGPFTDKKFADAQKLADIWYVQIHFIESYGALDKSVK